VNGPVAMGYLPFEMAKIGTRLFADLRGNRVAIEVCDLPFVPSRFKR
jgi:aminomethyltransferase